MLAAADRLVGEQIDVVVASDRPDGDGARVLREAASAPYVPDLVLTAVAPGDEHAGWPLYTGKVPRSGRPTAFACRGYACDAPTGDAAELARQVTALAAARSD
jgi:uncharacterized protein YyaL (SSP411 family)